MKKVRKLKQWPNGMQRRPNVAYERQLQKHSKPVGLPASLPLAHVTAAWKAIEIVKSGQFETRHCDVFDQELVYWFVLRPAYRGKNGDRPSHQLSHFPVAFVMRPEAVRHPRHVYPFDTGAGATGALANKADSHVYLEDYALEASHAGAMGQIGWAFGTVDAYFRGELRADIEDGIPFTESVTRGYIDVARMGREASNEHDKRASAIEMAATHDVQITDNLLLAILPKQYVEDGTDLVARLKKLRVTVDTYDWQPNRAPDEFQKDLMERTEAWFKTWSKMSK